ncbi:hypothetical protein [Amycolatopsis magusensis]|uniref:hypothetical protein n=1 Tax=Amycolatopsis magusensis TaxID=882444 RepID=UPI0037A4EC03
MAYDTEHDDVFRQTLEERFSTLEQCLKDLVTVLPHQRDRPGERVPDEPPNVDLLNECLNHLHNNWEFVTQFAEPSAGDARDMIGNLELAKSQNIHPINFGSGNGFLRERVHNQLENQTWVGAGRDAFDQRLNDLIVALASQEEMIDVLRETMELHRSLLCSARAKVLVVIDRAIRALRQADQAQDDPFGTLLSKVWDEVKQYLGDLDIVGELTSVVSGGPAGVIRSQVKDLGSALLHRAVEEIFGPDGDDPRPTLQKMLAEIRTVRRDTQQDSKKIAALLGGLDTFITGSQRAYLVHEEGAPLPDPDNNTDEQGGGTTVQVDPNSIDAIAVVLTEARNAIKLAMDRMLAADAENGGRPFQETPPDGGLPMFEDMATRWTAARTALEQAMDVTIRGTDITCQKVTTAATMYRNSDLANRDVLSRIAADFGLNG